MKKIGKLWKNILGILLIISSTSVFSTQQQRSIDSLIEKVSPALRIGIKVIDLNTNTTLYDRNMDEAFIPASNMKLFSDAAALMALGPDYRFKNQLSTTATQLEKGVLKGALYLTLPGDPSFTQNELKSLLYTLNDWNIKHIEGNVYIDSSHEQVSAYPPGWLEEDFIHSYAAPIAPLMIDMNRLLVTINPAREVNKPALIELNDESRSIKLNNQVTTKPQGKTCGMKLAMDQDNQLSINGCVALGQWAVQQEVSIRNPLLYAQALIKQNLTNLGVTLNGKVILGKPPENALLLATSLSKPIAQLMADTLKPSDNLYADSLFLHTAEKLNGAPVNWDKAQKLVKQFLQNETGIKLNQAILTDGSGLSRHDLLTPTQTVELLRFLYNSFPLSYEYIAALPVSGRDGTLQKRFKSATEQDLIRAKTGTMKGIVSLSGYLSTMNRHTLAFAIFINHVPESKVKYSGQYHHLIDSICSYFLQQRPKSTVQNNVSLFPASSRIKFQHKLPQTEIERKKLAWWRRLEREVKESLKEQTVTVIYRNNELILQDHQSNEQPVLESLNQLRKHYPFAIVLVDKKPPQSEAAGLLWIYSPKMPPLIQRTWSIRAIKGELQNLSDVVLDKVRAPNKKIQ